MSYCLEITSIFYYIIYSRLIIYKDSSIFKATILIKGNIIVTYTGFYSKGRRECEEKCKREKKKYKNYQAILAMILLG